MRQNQFDSRTSSQTQSHEMKPVGLSDEFAGSSPLWGNPVRLSDTFAGLGFMRHNLSDSRTSSQAQPP